jgi:hypothetical protein
MIKEKPSKISTEMHWRMLRRNKPWPLKRQKPRRMRNDLIFT